MRHVGRGDLISPSHDHKAHTQARPPLAAPHNNVHPAYPLIVGAGKPAHHDAVWTLTLWMAAHARGSMCIGSTSF